MRGDFVQGSGLRIAWGGRVRGWESIASGVGFGWRGWGRNDKSRGRGASYRGESIASGVGFGWRGWGRNGGLGRSSVSYRGHRTCSYG